jgi:hypothetical protein
MLTLLRREFIVERGIDDAWRHLARIEQWPSWARHIKKIDLSPPSELGPGSTGVLYLRNGIKSTFKVTEFLSGRSWRWVGGFLWATVDYDHLFTKLSDSRTSITFVVSARGCCISTIGRLFAWIYKRNLDVAIPHLVQEMNTRTK